MGSKSPVSKLSSAAVMASGGAQELARGGVCQAPAQHSGPDTAGQRAGPNGRLVFTKESQPRAPSLNIPALKRCLAVNKRLLDGVSVPAEAGGPAGISVPLGD